MKKTRAEKREARAEQREARVMDGLRAKVVKEATGTPIGMDDGGSRARAALLLDERLERIERLLEQLVKSGR